MTLQIRTIISVTFYTDKTAVIVCGRLFVFWLTALDFACDIQCKKHLPAIACFAFEISGVDTRFF